LPADKLLVIPNGVDVDRFAGVAPAPLASLGVAAGRRALVAIGRLDPQKGLDWLLETMPRVFAELPGHDLVLVGDGPQRAELETLAGRLGIDGRVHFAGFRADVPAILAASDLLLLPFATDVQGVAEILGPLAVEQVVPRDPARLAEKIAAILGNSELAARLARENQARARAEFSLPAMVASYERLYAALLAGT
jgi:glycosyltransferase involved in cell wall biosynthesis